MKVKDTSGGFENAPNGTHLAICVGLCGIGTHESEYNGQKRDRTQIIITWELPNELRQGGQPFIVSQFYTRSLSEKANLRQDLISWRGRDFTAEELKNFEMKNILGKGCQVTIVENDKGKSKVASVAGMPKGLELPEMHNALRHFDVEEFDQSEFDQISERLQEMVRNSREWAEIEAYGRVLTPEERRGQPTEETTVDDSEDIPF